LSSAVLFFTFIIQGKVRISFFSKAVCAHTPFGIFIDKNVPTRLNSQLFYFYVLVMDTPFYVDRPDILVYSKKSVTGKLIHWGKDFHNYKKYLEERIGFLLKYYNELDEFDFSNLSKYFYLDGVNELDEAGTHCLCGFCIKNVYTMRLLEQPCIYVQIGSYCIRRFKDVELERQLNAIKRGTVTCDVCEKRNDKDCTMCQYCWMCCLCEKYMLRKAGEYKPYCTPCAKKVDHEERYREACCQIFNCKNVFTRTGEKTKICPSCAIKCV